VEPETWNSWFRWEAPVHPNEAQLKEFEFSMSYVFVHERTVVPHNGCVTQRRRILWKSESLQM